MNQAKKVVVAFSGGVDSSMAVELLRRRGYAVSTVMFDHLGDKNSICAAQKIAKFLKVKLKIIDCRKEFKALIIDNFFAQLSRGLTPNPCTECNEKFKFGFFYDLLFSSPKYSTVYADHLFATGHYASLIHLPPKTKNRKTRKHLFLAEARDTVSDQSYFLYSISRDILSRVLFPLGKYLKTEIRQMAKKSQLANFAQKSSSDICFLRHKKFAKIIREKFSPKQGEFIDKSSDKVLGHHAGALLYTVGQRKGLEIGGREGFLESPFYVVEKDLCKNIVYVSQNPKDLYATQFVIKKCVFRVSDKDLLQSRNLKVKIRFRGKKHECQLEKKAHSQYLVRIPEKIFACAAGQYAVFYNKNICIGGGQIFLSN